MARKHLNIAIEGMVQGVGFRWSVRSMAQRMGVVGFVRNEVDGSVSIEAEAEEDALNEFVAWCRHGPPAASVDHVDTTPGPVKGFADFAIRL